MSALVAAVAEVARRAGGVSYPHGDDALTAIVPAREAGEYDVVLELSAASIALRVWGLERRYAIVSDGADGAACGSAAALSDWLALLGGETRVVVYDRGGSARCWAFAAPVGAAAADGHWYPRPPAPPATRWLLRWRKRVLANHFLSAAECDDARAEFWAAMQAAPELEAVA